MYDYQCRIKDVCEAKRVSVGEETIILKLSVFG